MRGTIISRQSRTRFPLGAFWRWGTPLLVEAAVTNMLWHLIYRLSLTCVCILHPGHTCPPKSDLKKSFAFSAFLTNNLHFKEPCWFELASRNVCVSNRQERAGTRGVPHFPQIKSFQGIFLELVFVFVYCRGGCVWGVCVFKVEGGLGDFDTDVNVEKQKQHTDQPYPYICYT